MNMPKDPVGGGATPVKETPLNEGGLTNPPYLVKVDRYGSVSGLVRVRVPIGVLVITRSNEAGSFDRSLSS